MNRLAKQEFGYTMTNLIIVGVVSVVLISYFEFTRDDAPWIIYALAIGPAVVGAFYFVSKVTIDDEVIKISYLMPFRKAKVFKHVEIEFSKPFKGVTGKGKPTLGILKAYSEENGIVLSHRGTNKFSSLSDGESHLQLVSHRNTSIFHLHPLNSR